MEGSALSAYTSVLRGSLESISFEDENFMEELLDVARLFRPFSEALDGFIRERGFSGDPTDAGAKTAFIRGVFLQAGMTPPREIREWFESGQPVKRETVFRICFAFGLDGGETDDFFRRIYARERGFDCHLMREAVYYFCLNNALTYADALEILSGAPEPGGRRDGGTVYTGSIIAELNELETREELAEYLKENAGCFTGGSATAREIIRRLWSAAAGPGGLLIQEREKLPSILDDGASGRRSPLRADGAGVRLWDAYLAILQLDRKEVGRLPAERSVRPILKRLHADVRDSFPDRQGIDRILRGEQVSYERIRKWLVLLTFYVFWAKKAVRKGRYEADPDDANRCLAGMNRYLTDAGYPELYVGNPYDWIFLYASKSGEPLYVFRYIWNELLTAELEEHP